MDKSARPYNTITRIHIQYICIKNNNKTTGRTTGRAYNILYIYVIIIIIIYIYVYTLHRHNRGTHAAALPLCSPRLHQHHTFYYYYNVLITHIIYNILKVYDSSIIYYYIMLTYARQTFKNKNNKISCSTRACAFNIISLIANQPAPSSVVVNYYVFASRASALCVLLQ